MSWNERRKDKQLKESLDLLRLNSERDPEAARHGREQFLAGAQRLRILDAGRPTHPAGQNSRAVQTKRSWSTAFAAILIAFVLLLGGTTGIVYASQSSLPNDSLYPVKIWSEDTLLSLSLTTRSRENWVMQLMTRRVNEMTSLTNSGQTVPAEIGTRLQSELDLSLKLMAGMDDEELTAALKLAQQQASTQLQTLNNVEAQNPGDATIDQTQENLQQHIEWVSMGVEDLERFRIQVQEKLSAKDQNKAESTPATEATEITESMPTPDHGSYDSTPQAPRQPSGTEAPPGPRPQFPSGGDENSGDGGNGGGNH